MTELSSLIAPQHRKYHVWRKANQILTKVSLVSWCSAIGFVRGRMFHTADWLQRQRYTSHLTKPESQPKWRVTRYLEEFKKCWIPLRSSQFAVPWLHELQLDQCRSSCQTHLYTLRLDLQGPWHQPEFNWVINKRRKSENIFTSRRRSPVSMSLVTAAVKPTPEEPRPVVLVYVLVTFFIEEFEFYLIENGATPMTHLSNWDFATEGSPTRRQFMSPRIWVPLSKFFSLPPSRSRINACLMGCWK